MNRWLRLSAAVTAMVMIGNLQYAWTLVVQPMMAGTGWKLSEVQWGFTIFIATMTWSMPLSGWLIDKLGPRLFMSMAALLCGGGWAALGQARHLPEFYAFYRSLQAYAKSLATAGTTLVLKPDSEFFKYFGTQKLTQPQAQPPSQTQSQQPQPQTQSQQPQPQTQSQQPQPQTQPQAQTQP